MSYYQVPETPLNALHSLFYLVLSEIPGRMYFYYPHYKDEETDVMGSWSVRIHLPTQAKLGDIAGSDSRPP